jgi:hypothetical protein
MERKTYVLLFRRDGKDMIASLSTKRAALKHAKQVRADVYAIPYPGAGWDAPTIRATFDPIYRASNATQQPRWKMIANLGDVHPIDYGGFFVYVDQTGVYAPEAELLESPDTDDAPEGWTVYRFVLEPCTYVNGILSDNPFHPDMPVWFADKLESIATTAGIIVEALILNFTSADPIARASAWRSVGDYFGFHELDHYPTQYSRRSHLPRRMRRMGE